MKPAGCPHWSKPVLIGSTVALGGLCVKGMYPYLAPGNLSGFQVTTLKSLTELSLGPTWCTFMNMTKRHPLGWTNWESEQLWEPMLNNLPSPSYSSASAGASDCLPSGHKLPHQKLWPDRGSEP